MGKGRKPERGVNWRKLWESPYWDLRKKAMEEDRNTTKALQILQRNTQEGTTK